MELLTLYRDILQYCGLRVGKQGKIETSLAYMGQDDLDKDYAVEIEGKSLFLPTNENLKTANKNGDFIFHPFHEPRNTGESEVGSLLRRALLVRINYTTMILGRSILEIASDPSMQRSMGRELRNIISQVGEVDSKSHHRWLEYVGKVLGRSSINSLVNIYVKKNGRFRGTSRSFVGVVSFPFLKVDHGVDFKFRKNEETLFKTVYEAIFPNHEEADSYGGYSEHRDIPRLEALINSAKSVTDRLNELIEAMADYLPDVNEMLFDTDFIDSLENLDPIRKEIRMIPPQKGNQGHAVTQEEEEDSKKTNYLPVPPSRKQTQEQSTQAPSDPQLMKPVPPPAQPAYQQPGYPYQPYPQPYAPPQPPQPEPAPQAPARQPAQLSTTEDGKLDFKSVELANPMVAAAGAVPTQLNVWAQAQQGAMGVPVVDPRTGAMYYQPVAPGYAQPAPAMSGYVPGAGPALAPSPNAYPPVNPWMQNAMQQPMAPGYYPPQPMGYPQAQPMLDSWGRPINRPVAQPAFAHGAVANRPVGRI